MCITATAKVEETKKVHADLHFRTTLPDGHQTVLKIASAKIDRTVSRLSV